MNAPHHRAPARAGACVAVALAAIQLAGCGDAVASSGTARPALEHKQTIALDTGVTIAYLETGPADGEPVLFLHGITDTSRSFRDTARRLSELRPDLRLFALDFRGHGGSSMPHPDRCRRAPQACFRVEDLAADTLAFLDAKGLPRAHLVGHSLGSLVAQELALQRPDRVQRIALVASSASVVGNAGIAEFLLAGLVEGSWQPALEARGLRFPADAYELTPLDADPEAESWMLANWVTEPTADPQLLAEIARETARIRIGTWLGAGRAVLAFDTRERLRALTVPTLVLWSTQDNMFPEVPEQRDLLAALQAAARDCGLRFAWKQYGRAPLPASGVPDGDIGHNLQWGAFEGVARDLASFLREDGAPNRDWVYADPADPRRIVVEPGAARVVGSLPRADSSRSSAACRRPATTVEHARVSALR